MRAVVFWLVVLWVPTLWATAGVGEVTIYGYVYYWNLEGASANSPSDAADTLVGGIYLPVRRTLVEVEYVGLTFDEQTYTDDFGRFSVTHRDPLVGDWNVNIEVRAEVQLDTVDDIATLAQVWESRLDLWPYNGESTSVTVSEGETRQIDVYIGGPQDNIESWWYGSDAENHAAFFISQVICDAYDWLTVRGIAPADIARDTSLFYPDTEEDVSCYNSTLSPPGIAWIDIVDYRLYPSDFPNSELPALVGSQPGDNWYRLRSSVLHEYAHKVMHDVYWAWPRALSLEQEEVHQTTSCISPELGWVEGWAEFLSAAILDWPTVNGRQGGSGEDNLEFSYHPDDLGLQDADKGSTDWREKVSAGCAPDTEAEVASVLWDLLDAASWEYLPSEAQDAAVAAGWPAAFPLIWHDVESDADLDDMWAILRDHNPDCLMDESDLWEDSFWYYWQDDFSADLARLHGLKAILYNRGITTESRPEHAPERLVVAIENARLSLGISERDPEDRAFLSYNIAYGRADGTGVARLYEEDQPIAGTWERDPEGTTQYADFRDFPYRVEMTGLALPRASAWDWLVVEVHDNMQCVFVTLANPGNLPEEIEEEAGPRALPDTDKASEAILLRAGVYTGSLGEKGERGTDLADYYKVDVVEGTRIRLHLDVAQEPPFNLSLLWPLKHPPSSVVQVEFSRSDAGFSLDLEYVATHTGEYFVHIGMPRVNPMPAGPYVLTIELTPP